MDTPQDKGDALENAVAAIEEVILQSSAGIGREPIIEKKKIIIVKGVRHEIDVSVTADLAPGYKPVFIFECKNWKEAVNKNEIILLGKDRCFRCYLWLFCREVLYVRRGKPSETRSKNYIAAGG